MSQENVEIVRRLYERFDETHQPVADMLAPDFAWDMSTFGGWPESPVYYGAEGMSEFLAAWLENFDDWELRAKRLLDAGDDLVVAIVWQRARSKGSGATVEMSFGQVWTVRGGTAVRMQMYADPAEALEAAGLSEQDAHADS
jgi:ketosteroid isomerase-like protein